MARLGKLVALLSATTGLLGAEAHESRPALRAEHALPASNSPSEALECFQVTNPVLSPEGLQVDSRTYPEELPEITSSCDSLLMYHVFANSYGQPFVDQYTPPKCDFNRVVLNLTVVSEGRQFDRLAIMYLGNIEVWRTSTAEPTAHPGIIWTYWKDMTGYLSLWKKPQTLIFDLGNIVDDKYTGPFNATLTATYYQDEEERHPYQPADVILPFSNGAGSQGAASAFVYPENQAVQNIQVPQNVGRAVFSVSATGQAAEEFWWSNVPESSKNVYGANNSFPGLSSFREVQLFIDGQVAGLSWPFPVIFTGGVVPSLHRPLVGLQAFDLREQEIDVTPWIGLLSDGKEHEFKMEVYGVDDTDQSLVQVPSNWVLTGKLFLWLDDKSYERKADAPKVSVSPLKLNVDLQFDNGTGQLVYKQNIVRKLDIETSAKGWLWNHRQSWSQSFSMSNSGVLKNQGNYQSVQATYSGEDSFNSNGLPSYSAAYRYPIDMSSEAIAPDGQWDLTLTADLTQGFNYVLKGPSAFATGAEPWYPLFKHTNPLHGVLIRTSRQGTGIFHQYEGGNKSTGSGDSQQTYTLGGKGTLSLPLIDAPPSVVLYTRGVSVNNGTVLRDREHFHNLGGWGYDAAAEPSSDDETARNGEYAPLPVVHHGGAWLGNFWDNRLRRLRRSA